MTKEERAMLREAAEKAKECQRDMSFSGLSDREIHERFIAFEKRSNPATILSLLDALDGAEKDKELKQAQIDRLMLEYCPDEMTAEQTANWAKHQVPADAEIAELADGLSKQARINQAIDAALQQVEEQVPRAGEFDKQEVASLRWLLNITTEFDRKDIRTRQAARLLDEVLDTKGISNRVHLESLWRKISGLPQARSRQSEQVSEQAALAAAQQGEREAFEAWSCTKYETCAEPLCEKYENGQYKIDFMNAAWMAWQAARTQPPAQPEGFVMVPKEPTGEMLLAGGLEISGIDDIDSMPSTDIAEIAFRAMLFAAPQAPGADKGEADEWYLQDKRAFVGNDMLFWAKDGKGYTTDLRAAHVYTKAEAESKQRMRVTDIPWPKTYIDSKARPAVDMQYVKKSEAALLNPEKE